MGPKIVMQTQIERFQKWRAELAVEEEDYIQSALLIARYVKSKTTLAEIANIDVNSHQYKQLNQYGKRTVATIVYCKLSIDEYLDAVSPENRIERPILLRIDNSLCGLYDDLKNNPVQKVADLLENIDQFFALNPATFSNKEEAIKLLFAFYSALVLVNITLNNLVGMKRYLFSIFVDINQKIAQLADLLKKTANKVNELNQFLGSIATISSEKKSIQDHFNKAFLTILNGLDAQDKKLADLDCYLQYTNVGLDKLIAARDKKVDIEAQIATMNVLLMIIDQNEQKITGRKYFLDLVDAHDSFKMLIDKSTGPKKEQLNANIEQLRTPNFYRNVVSKLLYSISWSTALVTMGYRRTVPQAIQNSISNKLPATLDSDCKVLLKELALEYLTFLNQSLTDTSKNITQLTSELSKDNSPLNELMSNESSEKLGLLIVANTTIKKAMQEYQHLSTSLKRKNELLRQLENHHDLVSSFIEMNDGFLVQLSNFFARFCSIFKSETAVMIDKAKALGTELQRYETQCQSAIEQEWAVIENNPDMNKEIKNKLSQELRGILIQTSSVSSIPLRKKEFHKFLMQSRQLLNSPLNVDLGEHDERKILPNI